MFKVDDESVDVMGLLVQAVERVGQKAIFYSMDFRPKLKLRSRPSIFATT